MKVNLPYLHLAALLFYLLLLVFFIFFDTLGPLFGITMLTAAALSKVVALSLLFFLGSWGLDALRFKKEAKKASTLEGEITQLKARLYDRDNTSHPSSKEESEGKIPTRQNFTSNT